MSAGPKLREHLRSLRELGCIVSGYRGAVTLHHCHGGSLREFGQLRGVAMKTSDWLQIPLAWEMHVGTQGIDVIGVETWEKQFGSQVSYLEDVSWRLGYSVFRLAGLSWPPLAAL